MPRKEEILFMTIYVTLFAEVLTSQKP